MTTDHTRDAYYASRGLRPAVARRYYRLLHPATEILDVGCGTGDFGRYRPHDGVVVHGIDGDAGAVASARMHERAVHGNLDGAPLPYADGVFDGVLARDIFEHVHDPLALARELRRVLRPGGTLVVSLVMAKPSAVWNDYTHLRGFTRSAAEGLLRDGGFTIERVWRMGGVPMMSRLGLIDAVPTLLRLPLVGHLWAVSWELLARRGAERG